MGLDSTLMRPIKTVAGICRQWHGRLYRQRWIPAIVWHGDEIDVRLTFTENRLPDLQTTSPQEAVLVGARRLHSGSFFEAEKHLRECGIRFDTGLGPDGRDWELDWSLDGPLRVRFIGRASRPERRQ